MATLNSSFINRPFNISVLSNNGTDQLRTLLAPAWVGSPNVRGTMDILQSCILTLVACIYTALHLDVPKKTTWQYLLWDKLRWVLVTLFAPEVTVYIAAVQLRHAWMLKSTLLKIRKEKQESRWSRDADFKIDLKYCFFIVMGAVRFDVHDILSFPDLNKSSRKYFDQHGVDRHSVRPGPAAIIRLAERGHWIRIRKVNIDDKSKANTIQKALVLLQVTWMVTQCLARRIYNLPLSLLEIHTIVHVICAMFLYACWFEKPLNIQEAVVLDTAKFRGELGVMLQRHYYSEKTTSMALYAPKHQQDDHLNLVDADGSPMQWIESQSGANMDMGNILPSGIALSRMCTSKLRNSSLYEIRDYHDMPVSFTLTHEFLARWDAILTTFSFEGRERLAEEAEVVMLESDATAGPQDIKPRQKILHLPMLEDFAPPCLSDWEKLFWEGRRILHIDGSSVSNAGKARSWKESITQPDFTSESRELVMLASILAGLYGGIHLTVWGQVFPSYVEEVMWKASCLLISGFIPISLVFTFANILVSKFESEAAMIVCEIVVNLASLPLLIGHIVARAFVIVESFLSLRQSPVGVFITPEWVEIFPHF
ncbi:hypothetical protein FLONG3_9844 [Fusarium longipes]|uniref:Uncharacterized protein n=1 Tax=Fusarium longipes TaxID=694270 RepID=A0A395RU53_9HYPO|nr:hypothetical protein FLONG3_9844 [Fusarium longipes]